MMFPRNRLDSLTDGIFSVAMTLLVLDVRLPDDFHAQSATDLTRALASLTPKLLPYALSFGVLGLCWLRNISLRRECDAYGRAYVHWWLIYLLLFNFVPFTAIVAGRFPDLAPATWLYAGTTFSIALVALRLLTLASDVETADMRDHKKSLLLMILSSALAVAWSFFKPEQALWLLAINLVVPYFTGRTRKAN
jgi:uncharacterized membrane protein